MSLEVYEEINRLTKLNAVESVKFWKIINNVLIELNNYNHSPNDLSVAVNFVKAGQEYFKIRDSKIPKDEILSMKCSYCDRPAKYFWATSSRCGSDICEDDFKIRLGTKVLFDELEVYDKVDQAMRNPGIKVVKKDQIFMEYISKKVHPEPYCYVPSNDVKEANDLYNKISEARKNLASMLAEESPGRSEIVPILLKAYYKLQMPLKLTPEESTRYEALKKELEKYFVYSDIIEHQPYFLGIILDSLNQSMHIISKIKLVD